MHRYALADAAFTPDGLRIVARSGDPEELGGMSRPGIVAVRLDGTDYRIVRTTQFHREHDIRVSPDGRFGSLIDGPHSSGSESYVGLFSLEGGPPPSSEFTGDDARWRADGGGVVYVEPDTSGADRENDLFSVDLDGQNERRLSVGGALAGDDATDSTYTGLEPETLSVFSPDGRSVAFESLTPAGRVALYVMSVDGTGVRRLTSHGITDRKPFWSADSRRILFTRRTKDRVPRLYTVEVATRRIRAVPVPAGFDVSSVTDWWSGPVTPAPAQADTVAPGVHLFRRPGSELRLSVFDRSGVARVSMAVDGRRPVRITSQASFARAIKRIRRGTHRLLFRTRDGAGNTRRQTIRLRLR